MKNLLIGKDADPAVMVRTIVLGIVVGRLLSVMEISPMDEAMTMAVSALVAWAYDRLAVVIKQAFKDWWKKPKAMTVLLAFLVMSPAMAQDVPIFSYQWSASGKEYTTVPVGIDRFGSFDLNLLPGIEVKEKRVPGLGLQLAYRFERDKWFGTAGLFVMFPQKAQPDFGFGLGIGVKF